ncbi:MAG: glycogen synthase GlgA [Planctomycetes bacterium]|nr:glycogen synthase GlgA [Planctomycetota bacterium]
MNVLFVTAEAHPLMKTGGLADVCGSLPAALRALGHDVRLLMPAYPRACEQVADLAPAGRLTGPARLLRGTFPGTRMPVYLFDAPGSFDRAGNPYLGPDGRDWPDNAARFAALCRAAVAVGMGRAGLDWRPEVVHAHDWHTGLVPALLSRERRRPATVFTIHNLAYQGLFPREAFDALELPAALWSVDGLEFHGQLSFIKGGIAFADRVTTVSPTYAREICTPELGCGLDGLLRARGEDLVGILNGADYGVWDPSRDPLIERPYDPGTLEARADNKAALRDRLGLVDDPRLPLVASVGRLVEQKGVDLLVDALPLLMRRPVQLFVCGTGDRAFAKALEREAARHDGRLAVHVGYTEELAHATWAGADIFVMPSRFEPCGLTQLYSLRYGAVPVVRRTGGLADTVVDADPASLRAGRATGFTFATCTREALVQALDRAMACWRRPALWRKLVRAGMAQEFSWTRSARSYVALYEAIRPPAPVGRRAPWRARAMEGRARARLR